LIPSCRVPTHLQAGYKKAPASAARRCGSVKWRIQNIFHRNALHRIGWRGGAGIQCLMAEYTNCSLTWEPPYPTDISPRVMGREAWDGTYTLPSGQCATRQTETIDLDQVTSCPGETFTLSGNRKSGVRPERLRPDHGRIVNNGTPPARR
jgi:hypothetical protein